MNDSSNCSILAITLVMLVALYSTDSMANLHDVESVSIVANTVPPEYDLGQIEGEVVESISRTKRNLWVRVALLEIDPLGAALGDDCGSGNAVTSGVGLLCEVNNSAAAVARRAAIDEAVDEAVAAHADSDAELAPDLAENVDVLLSSNWLQMRLASEIEDFVAKHTEIQVVSAGAAAKPGHRLAAGFDRVQAVSNKIDSSIAIRLHGEAVLINNDDGSVIDSYAYTVDTPWYHIEGWSQGGIGLLAKSVSEAISKMAEVLAEEQLLTVSSPRQRGTGYLVQALMPKHKSVLFGGSDFISIGGQYRQTDTLQPTFEWEDFRKAYAKDPLYTDSAAAEIDVSYDLRIYRSRPGRDAKPMFYSGANEEQILLYPGELVREFRGIEGESFTPAETLTECTPYAWTIRARFVVDGKTHITYWSGDYKEKQVEEKRKSKTSQTTSTRAARSVGAVAGWDYDQMMREDAGYYPFLAASPGRKCSNEEILAAASAKIP